MRVQRDWAWLHEKQGICALSTTFCGIQSVAVYHLPQAWRNNSAIMAKLLQAGADPNARDGESGW